VRHQPGAQFSRGSRGVCAGRPDLAPPLRLSALRHLVGAAGYETLLVGSGRRLGVIKLAPQFDRGGFSPISPSSLACDGLFGKNRPIRGFVSRDFFSNSPLFGFRQLRPLRH
jgi:hypothetical protein